MRLKETGWYEKMDEAVFTIIKSAVQGIGNTIGKKECYCIEEQTVENQE